MPHKAVATRKRVHYTGLFCLSASSRHFIMPLYRSFHVLKCHGIIKKSLAIPSIHPRKNQYSTSARAYPFFRICWNVYGNPASGIEPLKMRHHASGRVTMSPFKMLSQKTIEEFLSVCYPVIFCRAVSIALALNCRF